MCETRLYLRRGKPGSLGESCFSPCLDLSHCIFPRVCAVRVHPATHVHKERVSRARTMDTRFRRLIDLRASAGTKKARSPPPLFPPCFHPFHRPLPPPLRARDVETQLIPFESERNRRDAINRGEASEEAVV